MRAMHDRYTRCADWAAAPRQPVSNIAGCACTDQASLQAFTRRAGRRIELPILGENAAGFSIPKSWKVGVEDRRQGKAIAG
jgi:hypothetical protein